MISLKKCTGENCPIALKCMRYDIGTPNYNLNEWFMKPPFKLKKGVFSCKKYTGKTFLLSLSEIFNLK